MPRLDNDSLSVTEPYASGSFVTIPIFKLLPPFPSMEMLISLVLKVSVRLRKKKFKTCECMEPIAMRFETF